MKARPRSPESPRRTWRCLVVAIAILSALVVSAPASALGLTSGQSLTAGFPRVCVWWPKYDAAISAVARYGYVVLTDASASHIAGLRLINPGIILLNSTSCNEIDYYAGQPASDPLNAPFGQASAQWALTQVGSTLSADVSDSTTTFPVRAVASSGLTLFAVGDLVAIDEEYARVTAVGATMLTVQRGFMKPSAPHPAGSRVAAVVSMWPGAIGYDLSTYCPKATVDAAAGPETFAEWNARHAAAEVAGADWDGILLDRGDGNQSYIVAAGEARSIDADRSNTVPADYSAFDAAWNAGMRNFQDRVRRLVGEDPIILMNNSVTNYATVNGTSNEAFPRDSTTASAWHTMIFGPRGAPYGSYLDWASLSRQPNLAGLQSYELSGNDADTNPFLKSGWHPDYRKMRFGLTSALLGDGFFTYELSTKSHAMYGMLWFDEYDNASAGRGYLGQPLGAPRLAAPALTTADLLGSDGSFDTAQQLAKWSISYGGSGYAATTTLDQGAARVDVSTAEGLSQGVRLDHRIPVISGTTYTLTFRARADRARGMQAVLHQWSDPWKTWGDFGSIALDTAWRTYELTCRSSGTDRVAMLNLRLGEAVGSVWIDDLKVRAGSRPEVWRRDFQSGIVLVNPTAASVTIPLGGTFRRIKGTQAPTVNSGALASSVTIPSRDGIVLLRVPTASLVASATTLEYGRETTMQVSVTSVGSATLNSVRLEQRAAGTKTWRRVATLALDAAGRARFTRTPVSTTEYRVVLDAAGDVSNSVKIGVRPGMVLRPLAATVRRAGHVVFTGSITHPGRTRISVQRLSGGAWRTVRTLLTSSKGGFRTTVYFPKRGVPRYRVRFAGDTSHLSASSPVARITVR